MACKLYYKHGIDTVLIGTFKNRQKAEEHWNLMFYSLAIRHGSNIEPIYVETGKKKAPMQR